MSENKERRPRRAQHQLQTVLEDCRISNPKGLRLLEVGFKSGAFLKVARDAGIDAAGLEVEPGCCDSLHRQHPDLELILYDGKAVPLPDASCDLIVSYQVLEHVASLETTLAECIRLLKPGGLMYHVLPNYHSFYEGHYKILWWPFLGKNSGRRYLKLLRKYTPYYEHLNLVKPKTIARIMADRADAVDVLSLGQTEFKKRFTPDQIAKVKHAPLRGLLKAIHALPLLRQTLAALMCLCGLYYPITLIARKKTPMTPGQKTVA